MAAYHWEARRKQIMLDRRLALQARAARESKNEEALGEAPQKQMAPQKQPSQLCPDSESQHPEQGTTERCPCNTEHVPNHSGKLLKRYSDFEYTQQW